MSTPHRNFGKTFDNAIVLQQKKRESQERERNARDLFGRIHGVWPELTQEQLDNRPPSNLNVVVTPPLKFDKNMFKNRLPPQSFVVKDIDYLQLFCWMFIFCIRAIDFYNDDNYSFFF